MVTLLPKLPDLFRRAGDFVDTSEGVGVVHMAPGFGEDDQRVQEGLELAGEQHVDQGDRQEEGQAEAAELVGAVLLVPDIVQWRSDNAAHTSDRMAGHTNGFKQFRLRTS